MKTSYMTFFILVISASLGFAGSLGVYNGEFDVGHEYGPAYQFPDGWDDLQLVNSVHYRPYGSMSYWDPTYQAIESHIRFGWRDGCAIFQHQSLDDVTLNTIQADTLYTMIVRAKLDELSPTVGIGLSMIDPQQGTIVSQDFFNTSTDWQEYSISFDTSNPAYYSYIGHQISPAVFCYGGNNWLMVDYVKLYAGLVVVISDQPDSVLVQPGQDAQFSVSIDPQTSAQYQWVVSEDNIAGNSDDIYLVPDSNTITVQNIQPEDAGKYYYCIITFPDSTALSSEMAMLEVPKMMGHWKLDNNLIDSSSNGWDGTSSTIGYLAGIDSNAADFQGVASDSVEINNSQTVFNNFQMGLTVSCWMKVEPGQNDWSVAVGKSTSNSEGWELGMNKDTDGPFFAVRGRGAINSQTSIEDNNWHHVVGTWDGATGECKLYLNADLNSQLVDGRPAITNNAPVFFGSRNGSGIPHKGLIDDIRIYNYPLNHGQVLNLYNEFIEPDKVIKSVEVILSDGQGDFDPWNQERWAAWYTNGEISSSFEINCSLSFQSRATPWEPDLTPTVQQSQIFDIPYNQGITIDGNNVIIDLRESSHSLDWCYDWGWLLWSGNTGAERGFLFRQSESSSHPETVLKNITLKGFVQALRTGGGQSHPLTIMDSTFTRNDWGLYFSGQNTTLTNCDIIENAKGGIYSGYGSHDNALIANTWRDNQFNTSGDTAKSYADIVLDTAYNTTIESNYHNYPDQGFHVALSMYRNMGESGNLREDAPHNNTIKNNTVNGYDVAYHAAARMGRDGSYDLSGQGRDYANYNTFENNHINNSSIGIKINDSGNKIVSNTFTNTTNPIVLHTVFYSLRETTINDQAGDNVSLWFTSSDYSGYSSWFPFQNDLNGGISASEKLVHVRSDYNSPNFGSSGSAQFVLDRDLLTDNESAIADFDFDSVVTFSDFAKLALRWMDSCYSPSFCQNVDLLFFDNQINSLDLSIFSDYWLNSADLTSTYSTITPIDFAAGDFYINSPGDEIAVIFNEKVTNISGNEYYTIIIYDSTGIEINRSSKSTKKMISIAAGDFISEPGDEFVVALDSSVGGFYPIYCFRRGFYQSFDTLLTDNTSRVIDLAAGNFNTADDLDEIAVIFEDSNDIHYVKPLSGWSALTTEIPYHLAGITAGNLDQNPSNGDEIVAIIAETSDPGQTYPVYFFRPNTAGPIATAGNDNNNYRSAITTGSFLALDYDQVAVSFEPDSSGANLEFFEFSLPQAQKSYHLSADFSPLSLSSGKLNVGSQISTYDMITGFSPQDLQAQLDLLGDHLLVLPDYLFSDSAKIFWWNINNPNPQYQHLRVTPLFN